MNFGEPGKGHQRGWAIGRDEARPIFQKAIDSRPVTLDCADIHGMGACEEVVGILLRGRLPSDDYVLATIVSLPIFVDAVIGDDGRTTTQT